VRIAVVAPTAIPALRANTLQVMKMTQALAVLGHEVRLAAPGRPPGSSADWDELKRLYGLQKPFPLQWLPSSPRLKRYDYGWQAVRWARLWGADLIYTRLPQAAALSSLSGMPTVMEIHDMPQGRMGPLVFRAFLRGRGARRLAAITRSLAEDLARCFNFQAAPPFTVISPDGVDLERYENLPSPQAARAALPLLRTNGFTAGYTGHLYAGRGIELILDLAAALPEVTFLLAGGEPPDVARLRAKAEAAGLPNLILTGFISNAELPVYQAACDVLLMPYQRRVAASSGGDIARYLSPMKLFEYLACGRPILSSDLPVIREVLHAGNSILLPPDDTRAWAAALNNLCSDPARRAALGDAARRDAGQYTWVARAEKVLEGLSTKSDNQA
jgi:glycosyltransferase involved in cell wall biosynthesis